MKNTTMGMRVESRNPQHVRVSVWIGQRGKNRARAGELIFRTEEWDDLSTRGDTRRGFDVIPPLHRVAPLTGPDTEHGDSGDGWRHLPAGVRRPQEAVR